MKNNQAKRILVTGSDGFIGKNLKLFLQECPGITITTFVSINSVCELQDLVSQAECIFHMAGINRSNDPDAFKQNELLTKYVIDAVQYVYERTSRFIPIIFTSSIHATSDTPYGVSKLNSENLLNIHSKKYGHPVYIYRLPNVFGKWCLPNYNSVVATFCYNISRGIPLKVDDPEKELKLVYIDDVISDFKKIIKEPLSNQGGVVCPTVSPEYTLTVGELKNIITRFHVGRTKLFVDHVSGGLLGSLYSTYISYLEPKNFSYKIDQHSDSRGVFAEVIKTPDCGQVSFFTAYKGQSRGGHYHHSKTEKFLIVQGSATFKFKNVSTGELYEVYTNANELTVVDTIPGWSHDVTNTSSVPLIAVVWASENYNADSPDTITCKIK